MFQSSVKILAFFVFASLCLAIWYFAERKETQVQGEADVSEVVFRRILEMPDLTQHPEGRGVCIRDEQNRFDQSFLKRFREKYPELKLARNTPSQTDTPPAPKGRKCEITIWVDEIRWLNPFEVDVRAGYYCGVFCAYGADFHLRRAGWGWYIDSISGAILSDLTGPPMPSKSGTLEDLAAIAKVSTWKLIAS